MNIFKILNFFKIFKKEPIITQESFQRAYDKSFREYQNKILNPPPIKEKWEVQRDAMYERMVNEALKNSKRKK